MTLPHPINQLLSFDLRNQNLVFDMDGTLLHGDLGETVFYYILMAAHLQTPLENFELLLEKLRLIEKFVIDPAHPAARVLLEYLNFKNNGALSEAYLLTAEYFDRLDQTHLSDFAHKILAHHLPPFSKMIRIGNESIKLDFYAQTDPMMIEFLHQIETEKRTYLDRFRKSAINGQYIL